MNSTIFLALTISWLIGSGCAVFRLHRTGWLSLPIMMTSWLVGDHPGFHLAAQGTATALFAATATPDTPLGWTALGLATASWVGLLRARQVSRLAKPTADAALADALEPDWIETIDPALRTIMETPASPARMRPDGRFRLDGIDAEFNIAYGPHPKRNLLDIYRRPGSTAPAPVLIHVHGGGWVIGHKQQQGMPLMLHLARRGWVCVSINYRLAPKHRFPDQIIDVKRAIAWVRSNIADHGGDPNIIVLTGGSAGGHLTSLAALTPGLAEFQPGFEDADTSVAGCVPFYGPPDFTDRNGIRGRFTSMEPFLARMVMPEPPGEGPMWNLMSPIDHVNTDAPPFLIVQGSNDVLVWREETRAFVDALRSISAKPVAHWEIPGAQHAFDVFPCHRTSVSVRTVEAFLTHVVSRHTAKPQPATPPSAGGN